MCQQGQRERARGTGQPSFIAVGAMASGAPDLQAPHLRYLVVHDRGKYRQPRGLIGLHVVQVRQVPSRFSVFFRKSKACLSGQWVKIAARLCVKPLLGK